MDSVIKNYTYAMKTVGFYLVKKCVEKDLIHSLRDELDTAIKEDQNKYDDYEKEHRFTDIVHCMISRKNTPFSKKLFENKNLLNFVDAILGDKSIIHSFNAVRLNPFVENNASKIHRDTPRFYQNSYPLSIQAIVCLDKFNEETGATYLLPGSHHVQVKPSDEYFYKNAYMLNAEPGDVLFFDSLVWHCAGKNNSNEPRRGITLVYTRSFMKQQIDLPSFLDSSFIYSLSERGKILAGMNVIPPKNLEEFFAPEEKRPYKSNQG